MENLKCWLTAKEAAAELKISAKTVIRKIEKGELIGEKHMTKFGPQFFVDPDQLQTAKQIIDVITVRKEHSVEELSLAITKQVYSIFDPMLQEIEALKKENIEARNEAEKNHSILLEKIDALLAAKSKTLWDFLKWKL